MRRHDPARRTFLTTHWKTLLALLIVVFVALLTLSPSAASPGLAAQLRQHAEAITQARASTALPDARERYLAATLARYGYAVSGGAGVSTIEASRANVTPGQRPERIFIVGAHADASASAAVLELARVLRTESPAPGTELKFVFLVDRGRGPDSGNFIAFAGSRASSAAVGQALAAFRAGAGFADQGLAAPAWVQGVTLSSHRGPGRLGYPALLIADTAFARYPYHHSSEGDAGNPDYEDLARVVDGLARTIGALAGTTRS